jgi:hypothetical protein
MDTDDVVAKLADELPSAGGGAPLVLSADRDMFRYSLPHAASRVFAEFAFTQAGPIIYCTPRHRMPFDSNNNVLDAFEICSTRMQTPLDVDMVSNICEALDRGRRTRGAARVANQVREGRRAAPRAR